MASGMVDATRARSHVRKLIADGMTQADICEAAYVTGSALQILLHGHYTPSRPPQQTINSRTEAALLAVELKVRQPTCRADTGLCSPGGRFAVAGYRVGRCDDCGQLAPIRRRRGLETLTAHPEPAFEGGA